MTLFDQFVQDFQGKRVLIFGLGLLGSSLGDALLFAHIGCPLRITDTKSADILRPSLDKLRDVKADYILGVHRHEDIDWAQVIIRNAAVPWHHPLLEYARDLHKPVHMDVELFLRYARGVTTIGITGTRGKTTTTHLIYEILKNTSAQPLVLGGNVKDIATLPLLKSVTNPRDTRAVLELSSWQLQSFHSSHLSPNLAVITNLYPDHQNVYDSLTAYYSDKQAIYQYQKPGDVVFLNRHVKVFHEWAKSAHGKVIWFDPADLPSDLELPLRGIHNQENAAAAYQVGLYLGISSAAINNVLSNFSALPHRLETVRIIRGVTYVNDTTATTPVAAVVALKTVSSPVTLILGGSDKKLPIDDLVETVNQKADKVILLTGNGTERIKPLLNQKRIVIETDSLQVAVARAAHISPPGSTVLLSPGFTSFGLFQNEYHRGEEFIRIVNSLV
jgi:UDP-N-acetylmuramoylalanine--D-glutamate ligase